MTNTCIINHVQPGKKCYMILFMCLCVVTLLIVYFETRTLIKPKTSWDVTVSGFHMDETSKEAPQTTVNNGSIPPLKLCQRNTFQVSNIKDNVTADHVKNATVLSHVQKGGIYKPRDCKPIDSVAIIIPYRDREKQLEIFINYMHAFLQRQQLQYGIFVVELSEKIRTFISEEQQEALEEFFGRGMTSKGKQCQSLKEEAAVKTGLPVDVITNWIGNHRKSVQQKKYTYPKALYERGMTGYNLFIHENKDDVGKMDSWADSWQGLPDSEKLQYKNRAREFQPECDQKKKGTAMLKKVGKMLMDLLDVGIDLVCFGVDTASQDSIVIGEGKTANFVKEMPDLINRLYTFYEFAPCTQEKDKNKDVKELRKLCQEHMNKLYYEATGKQGPFPYKAVANGSIMVTGLPADVLPLRTLSNYGEQKLSSLLATTTLNISTSQPGPSNSNSQQEASLISQPGTSNNSQQEERSAFNNISSSLPGTTYNKTETASGISHPGENLKAATSVHRPDISVCQQAMEPSTSSESTLQVVDASTASEIEGIIDTKLSLNAVLKSPTPSKEESDILSQNGKSGKRKSKESAPKTKRPRSKTKPETLPGKYDVEEIFGLDIRNGRKFFHIRWKDYPLGEATWEPEENIPPSMVKEYIHDLLFKGV